MPKDRRGGRSVKKRPYNEYDVIGYANNGTIKVLKAKPDSNNNGIPMFSNKTNTVYFIVNANNAIKKGRDEITNIGIYRNRHLVYNIDLADGAHNDHVHTWVLGKVRDKVALIKVVKNGKDHDENLTPAQQKLLQMAKDWNNGGS